MRWSTYVLIVIVVLLMMMTGTPLFAGDSEPVLELELPEPLGRDWEPAWVSWDVALGSDDVPVGSMRVATADGGTVMGYARVYEPANQKGKRRAAIYAHVGLRANEVKTLHVEPGVPTFPILTAFNDEAGVVNLASDLLAVEAPMIQLAFRGVHEDAEVPPPIFSVRRRDGEKLARGRIIGLERVQRIEAAIDEPISHTLRHQTRYECEGGRSYAVTITLTAHEPVVIVEEDFSQVAEGRFVLDLSPKSQITHGHGRGRLHPSGEGKLERGYEIDFREEWTGRIQPFYAWWNDYGLWWSAYKPDGDYIGILPLEPTQWTNPAYNPIEVHTGQPDKVDVQFPFRKGTRKWAIVFGEADEALKTSVGGANLMMKQAIRLGQNPLNDVKDMTLIWPGMDDIGYPHLLCSYGDVPDIRWKARTHPLFREVFENNPDAPNDPAGLYLAMGDEKHARQATDDLIADLRGWVEDALDGSNYGEAMCAIGFTRPLRRSALIFDLVAGSDSMTADERNYCLRAFAFLAYCLYDEERWPPRYQAFARGNVNFHSDDYTCRAAVVALLKGHPMQRKWMDYVSRELRFEFDSSVYPGGAWCEAPNYQGFTMHYLMIAVRIMQLNGFEDFSTEPRFKATMDYFFRIQTPRDVRVGHHMLPTVGDTTSYYHSQSLQNVFAWAAALFAETDPDLAGRMMFAWKRGGSIVFGAHGLQSGAGWTQPLQLIDPSIPARPPTRPLPSERLPGYGAIFRNNWNTDRESYFLFKMGQADQHYDSDEGSFHWYALGRPISLDFGCMYNPSIVQPWLHSTLDFGRQVAWTRGEVTTFHSLPQVDLAVGELAVNDIQRVPDLPGQQLPEGEDLIERGKRFISWRRQVLFVKGPDYVVLRDDIDDADNKLPTGWSVQVMSDGYEVDGPCAKLRGQHGVDLQVLAIQPVGASFKTSRWGYDAEKAPEWIPGAEDWSIREEQTALHLQAGVDDDYLVALVPNRSDEAAPVLRRVSDDVVSIRHAGGEDLVMFAGQGGLIQADDVTFSGQVGIVRQREEAVELHILDGVSMRIPGMIAQFPGPVSLEISPGRIRGHCDGEVRTCFLHWLDNVPPIPANLTIDGQPAYAYSTFDGYLSFTVTDGPHRFEVTYDMTKPGAP